MTFSQIKKGTNRLFSLLGTVAGLMVFWWGTDHTTGLLMRIAFAIISAVVVRLIGSLILWIMGGFAKEDNESIFTDRD